MYGNKASFIGYIRIGNVSVIPFCRKLLQMNGYVKYFDENNKYMNILVHNKEFLQKYNEIWEKVSIL